MPPELKLLASDRERARSTYIQARMARDSAARYLDAVVDDLAATRAAWDSFTERQEQMDRAGDRLAAASSALIAYLMDNARFGVPVRTTSSPAE